ncbi:TonB-dependent receptor family protein [Afipia birgiae]|jgi:Fe(3+) dicitrate transport protein|uniref:TonB-dependent receptor family protein n=1 Tax=Afipia birgiae TaxID=151414 RepID=UPI0003140E0C|nr:TonB-dependent siderophore receptor [Afipia birgiae]MBX9822987.1 TonB-dependent siderophore receptor [Afipia birgiae]
MKSIRCAKTSIGGLLGSITAVALLSSTSICLGQAAGVALSEIDVRGNWLGLSTEGDVRTYPGARTLVTAEEIKQSGAKSVEDVLRRVPGIQIFDETGIGILPNIGVRGLNPLRSERTMVLVDGVPIAPGPYTGTGLSLFPVTLESIDRIDVVRGGAAVHFGPNNIGGVINIITKQVPNRTTATLSEKLSFATRSGKPLTDTYMSVGGPINDQAGLQLQANFIGGSTDRQHSNNGVINVLADGYVNLSNNSRIRTQLQYYRLDSELPGALTPLTYQRDPTLSQRPYDGVKGDAVRGAVTYTQDFGENARFIWTNFGHALNREFTFAQPFDPAVKTTSVSNSPRSFRVVGSEPQFIVGHETLGISQKLTVGARYVREDVDFSVNNTSLATQVTIPQRDWRFGTNGYAAYVSNTFNFFDERLSITPGTRFELVETNFQDSITQFASGNTSKEWLPGLAVGYKLTDAVFLFANTNRSLRPPQVAQVTRGGAVGAEIARVYEAGTRITPMNGLEFTATAFRFNYEDQIEFDRAKQLYVNLGQTKHEGLEFAGRWSPQFLPGLGFGASYTNVHATQLTGLYKGRRVPFSSEHLVNLTADYRTGPWMLATGVSRQSEAFSDAANSPVESKDGATGPIPAYWLWNAKVSYQIVSTPQQTTELSLALNNILDANYYFRGVDTSPIGRVPGPGRSVTVGLRATF